MKIKILLIIITCLLITASNVAQKGFPHEKAIGILSTFLEFSDKESVKKHFDLLHPNYATEADIKRELNLIYKNYSDAGYPIKNVLDSIKAQSQLVEFNSYNFVLYEVFGKEEIELNISDSISKDSIHQIIKKINKNTSFKNFILRQNSYDIIQSSKQWKIILCQNLNTRKWYVVPYEHYNFEMNYKTLGGEGLIEIENLSGLHCSTDEIPLMNLGEFISTNVEQNKYQDILCQIGASNRSLPKLFPKQLKNKDYYKSLVSIKHRQLNGLLALKERMDLMGLEYLTAYNVIKSSNSNNRILILEYKMKDKFEYHEIEIKHTSDGWFISKGILYTGTPRKRRVFNQEKK